MGIALPFLFSDWLVTLRRADPGVCRQKIHGGASGRISVVGLVKVFFLGSDIWQHFNWLFFQAHLQRVVWTPSRPDAPVVFDSLVCFQHQTQIFRFTRGLIKDKLFEITNPSAPSLWLALVDPWHQHGSLPFPQTGLGPLGKDKGCDAVIWYLLVELSNKVPESLTL